MNFSTLKFSPSHTSKHATIEPFKSKMKLQSNSKDEIISKSDILYMKSDSNYCEVFLRSGKRILCSQTLKSMEEKMSAQYFFRPHQSYVFNIRFLESVSSSMTELELSGNIVIPISRSNRSKLRAKLEIWFD